MKRFTEFMTAPKRPAMLGNTNAQHGDEAKTSVLYIRVTPQQKSAYVRAAAGGKLSEWVTSALDASANAKRQTS